jgi:hypothetical protein
MTSAGDSQRVEKKCDLSAIHRCWSWPYPDVAPEDHWRSMVAMTMIATALPAPVQIFALMLTLGDGSMMAIVGLLKENL